MEALLVMFKADGTRLDFKIKPDRRYIIGRKDTCDLRIPLSAVSREHAAVFFEAPDDELIIEDLGSSNGTYVNNEKIDRLDLCPGDLVMVGPIPFQVQIGGHPKEIKPPKPVDGTDSVTIGPDHVSMADDDDDQAPQKAYVPQKTTAVKKVDEDDDGPVEILDLTGDDDDPTTQMPDESDSFFAFDLEEDDD